MLIKKFYRMLSQCEEEHVFRGTIIDFDTVDYVPKERLAKGMIVHTEQDTRRVNFALFLNNRPVMDALLLNVGDQVLVLGAQHENRGGITLPTIIMIQERKSILFAKERDMFSWKGGWGDYLQAISYLISIVLVAISMVVVLFPIGTMSLQNMILSLQIGSIAFIFFIIVIGVDWYRSHIRRPIMVRCDSETWKIISDEVMKRFSISVS